MIADPLGATDGSDTSARGSSRLALGTCSGEKLSQILEKVRRGRIALDATTH